MFNGIQLQARELSFAAREIIFHTGHVLCWWVIRASFNLINNGSNSLDDVIAAGSTLCDIFLMTFSMVSLFIYLIFWE